MSKLILYDGECSLCNSQVRLIRRYDRRNRFRFIALQSEEGRSMLRTAGLNTNEPDTIVYAREGQFLLRSSAVLGIAGDLGGAWSLLRIFNVIPSRIRDFFYRIVARNRHRLAPRPRSRQ